MKTRNRLPEHGYILSRIVPRSSYIWRTDQDTIQDPVGCFEAIYQILETVFHRSPQFIRDM